MLYDINYSTIIRMLAVIGDVHGCLEELDELLCQLCGIPIVLTGDLVDKGPDPVGVVRRARETGLVAVRGNHDDKCLRWLRYEHSGKRNPMTSVSAVEADAYRRLSAEDIVYLTNAPVVLPIMHNVVVVHAGFLPGKPITAQDPREMLRIRWVNNSNGKMASLEADLRQPANTTAWQDLWQGPESVVYGHNVVEHVRIDNPRPNVYCYGVDTGCVFGGKLTALLLPSLEVVQVSAKQRYATKPGE